MGGGRRSEVEWPILPFTADTTPSVPGLLGEAARALFQSLGEASMLVDACRITREVLRADVVVALEWAEDIGAFRSRAQYGLSETDWAEYQVVEIPPEIGEKIRERLVDRVVSVLDVGAPTPAPDDAARREIARKMGIGPLLLLGLRDRGALIGVMVACRTAPGARAFEPWAIEVAEGLSPLVSASLENLRLLTALEGANQAQADFLASMSHELRTPLNVITGYLDILLQGDAGDLSAPQRDLCERTRASALQQLSLVAEALEISRRDLHGQLPVRHEPVLVRELVADLERETTLRGGGAELRVTWTPPLPGSGS